MSQKIVDNMVKGSCFIFKHIGFHTVCHMPDVCHGYCDIVVFLHRFHADRPDGKHRDALMLSRQPFSRHFSFFEIGLIFFALCLLVFA